MRRPEKKFHVQVWVNGHLESTDEQWAVSAEQARSRFCYKLRERKVFADYGKSEAWEVTP